MTSEFSQSSVSTLLPSWKIGLSGSLSLSMFLVVGVAQASPLPNHSPDRAVQPEQIIAEEQARLAQTQVDYPEGMQSPPTAIAATSSTSPSLLLPPQWKPAVVSSPVRYSSEDELIQQVTGKAVVPRVKPAETLPAFAPPSATAARSAPPVASNANKPAPKTPILVTAGTNSDLGLKLFAPGSTNACGAACEPSLLTVPSSPQLRSPSLAQSTPPPPYLTLPAPVPDGSQAPGLMQPGLTQPGLAQPGLMQPAISSPASIQPPGLRTQIETVPAPRRTLLRTTALSDPSIRLQGVYLYQGDEGSARARLSISYPLTPNFLFGATFDLTDGNAFADSRTQGFSVNELYFAASLPQLPNLRLVVGQLDLTSYFDRNSFAKDGATHFFNTVFQTNPALSATGISSRPAALINWTLTDNIEAKAAVFSSSRDLSDFSLDGFAGEVGIRYGNAVIRATYASARDAGSRDGFQEIFQVDRGNGVTGPLASDREESYGLNGELFIPSLKMGIFARYGRYTNAAISRSAETYNLGVSFLDLFAPDDRLGLAYGRGLSNGALRQQVDGKDPDVLELFYDFRFLPNLRLGFSIQERNQFSETVAGVRVKTEFDVTPRGRGVQ
ncbi:MAG: carbohydrate porin [Stenomitos frigidus ULC029]